MQITFKAQSTRGTLAEAIRHVYRPRLRLLRVIGVLLSVAGLVLMVVDDAALGAVYLAGGAAFAWLGPQAAVYQGVNASIRLAALPTTFTLAPGGVSSRSALVDGHVAWPDVTGVDELPRQLLLRLDGSNFLAVPTGDLTDAERALLRTVLRENRPQPRPADGPAAA